MRENGSHSDVCRVGLRDTSISGIRIHIVLIRAFNHRTLDFAFGFRSIEPVKGTLSLSRHPLSTARPFSSLL